MSQKAQMMKKKWFRQLVLFIPTITGKRSSNKTEDYGVFQPSKLSHLDQLSIYVSDIQQSRKWSLPDKIVFVETLPKTSVGKVDKKQIRVLLAEMGTNR